MENQKIKIKVLEGATVPVYIEHSSGFDLKVHSFKRVFKGREEIDLKTNLQHSIKRGKIVIRPFERIIIGTGLVIDIPEGYKLDIVNKQQTVIQQGLISLSTPIDSNYKGELDIFLYNGSQFLSEITIGMVVAKGIFSTYERENILYIPPLSSIPPITDY
jgi:dUTPase